jgi:Fic family protein
LDSRDVNWPDPDLSSPRRADEVLRQDRCAGQYNLDLNGANPSFERVTWNYIVRIQVVQDLVNSPMGVCVPISGYDHRFGETYETHAFLPHDLPTALDLSPDVWLRVTNAMAELGRLDAAASMIPNPALVTRIATRREAIGTSALEGTFANLDELLAAEELLDEDATNRGDIPPNVREVMNYARAADAGYAWVRDRPITTQMVSALQALSVKDTSVDESECGRIRERQVFVGAQSRRISDARFIPPPPGDQLRQRYDGWAHWLTDARVMDSVPVLARLALAHYQFETIHPYVDRNGRLGRLIPVLQLLREGALRSPVLSVSPWLKDRADEYRDHLLAVSTTGQWGPWVSFFADGVAAQSRDGHDRIMRLLDVRDEISQTVRSALPKARLAVEIADDLIAFPMLTVAAAHRRYGRSNEANRNAIAKLVEVGMIEPYTDARYDRVYWSRRVYQVIDS